LLNELPHQLQNGHHHPKADKEKSKIQTPTAQASSTLASSVSALISPPGQHKKMPPDFAAEEMPIKSKAKNEQSTATIVAPPPSYQQAAQRATTTTARETEKPPQKQQQQQDLEKIYANAMKKSKILGKLAGMPKFVEQRK
jgi:hypothetical protein